MFGDIRRAKMRSGSKLSFSAVRSSGKMRFNKSEVAALALGQPSHKFEKEGVLFVKEKQEGFFRRSEISVERWCRLRGNLLFYFKSRDHWSEPAGVIVIEDCQVRIDQTETLDDSTFGLVLAFGSSGGGPLQHLATYTEAERDSWMAALKSASHHQMKSHLRDLRAKLNGKLGCSQTSNDSLLGEEIKASASVIDLSEAPLCEMSLSCDNLLCDALGRSPSAKIVISVRNLNNHKNPMISWSKLCQTEVSEKSSNPVFMRTILLSANLSGGGDKTQIKLEAYDMREKYTSTKTLLGSSLTTLSDLKNSPKMRLKLESPNPDGRTAGFVTINATFYDSRIPASTDSTPVHRPSPNLEDLTSSSEGRTRHKRSHSLPSAIRQKAKFPPGLASSHLNLLFSNPVLKSFRFHSGLAGDINVQEILCEPKLCMAFPQQLLTLWICEEKELVHEIAGLGELKSPWHASQMAWLENHLNIINTYSQALENLDNYKGPDFRKSEDKSSQELEFVPVNLHLQRMWAENDSLRKSAFYDIITHGAFTSIPMKSPGLIKMLKELKAPQSNSQAWCSQSDSLQMAEDTLSAVRRVRREVVDSMRMLMKAAKEKRSQGMFALIEEMLRKTKCLCSLLDQNMVEQVFSFLEDNRVTIVPENDEFSQSVADFMAKNKMKIDLPLICRPRGLLGPSLQTPCTEFVAKELRTPEVDLIFSPVTGSVLQSQSSSAENSGEFWRSYSAYTSGYQSVDRLSDIDEFEESFRYLSVMDKTRHYYTLCRAASPLDTPPMMPGTPAKMVEDEGIPEMEYEDEFSNVGNGNEENLEVIIEEPEVTSEITSSSEEKTATAASEVVPEKKKVVTDQNIVNDVASGLHYKAGDEPEPIDLTHLNIEAAMMCLASKVRLLSGKANSPTLSSRTFRFKELEAKRNSEFKSQENFKIPDVPKPSQDIEAIEDWTAELRPSMRKLRQGMDSLCKTAKLSCSVLRLQQTAAAVQLTHQIKYRRDVCFSQALTTCVTALMTKFWTWTEESSLECENFLKICTEIGPLVAFESLLSLNGDEDMMFNDMIVVVEDLRNVEFNLILVDKSRSSKFKLKKAKDQPNPQQNSNSPSSVPMLEYHSFPLPRITGSRSNLKVLLPVPDYVYTLLPLDQMKTMTFSLTPVFFNIGINEKATIAHKMGNNGPQEKNNIDNFKTLAEYYRRFKRINLSTKQHKNKRFSSMSNEADVDDLLNIMKDAVHCKKNKNVDILHLASQICRRMHGLRFTNCKSGKDRTGMAVTLEQIQILSREYDLAEHEYQKALDAMRSEGTRIENCEKNIGRRKFAFGALQLAVCPYQYRPPVGTYQPNST